MTTENGLTIEKIKRKEKTGQNQSIYYLVFFKEHKTIVKREDGSNEERPKAFFVWNSSQAFEMINEGIFKEGDRVNASHTSEEEYHTLRTLSRYVDNNSPVPGRRPPKNINEWTG